MANYINHQQAKQGIESAIARRQYNNSLEGSLNNTIQNALRDKIGLDTLENDQKSIANRLVENIEKVKREEYVDPKEYDSLVAESENIGKRLGYLRNYLRNADPNNAEAIKEATDASKNFLDASKAMADQQKFYSAFKDADDYQKQMDAYKEQQRLTFDYDLNAGKSKLDAAKGTKEYDKLKAEYEAAKYFQDDYKYEQLKNNEDFAEKSKKAKTKFGLNSYGEGAWAADYINGKWYSKFMQGLRNVGDSINFLNKDELTEKFNRYDFMTDDQVDTFNYIFNTEGQDAAQKYLDHIESELAQKYVKANKTDNWFVNTQRAINAGTESIGEGLGNFIMAGMRNNVESVEKSKGTGNEWTKYLDEMIKENAAPSNSAMALEARKKEASGIEKLWYDVAQTAPNTLVNMFVPFGLGLVITSLSAAGNAYAQATIEEKSTMERSLMALGEGSMEAVTNAVQKLGLKGIEKLGTGTKVGANISSKLASVNANMSKSLAGSVTKTLGKYGYHMFSEGLEEGIQEIASTELRNAIYGENNELDWGEIGYNSLLGAASAGMLQGVATAANIYRDFKLPPPTESHFKETFDTAPKDANFDTRYSTFMKNLDTQDSVIAASVVMNAESGSTEKANEIIDDAIKTYEFAKEYNARHIHADNSEIDSRIAELKSLKKHIANKTLNIEAAKTAATQGTALWQIAAENNDAAAKVLLQKGLSNAQIENSVLSDSGIQRGFRRLTGTDLSQYKTVSQKRNAVKNAAQAYQEIASSDIAKQVTEILKANNSQTDAAIRSENRVKAQKLLEEAYRIASAEDKQARDSGNVQAAKIAQTKMQIIRTTKDNVRNGNTLAFASLDGSTAVNNARKYTESAPKVEPKYDSMAVDRDFQTAKEAVGDEYTKIFEDELDKTNSFNEAEKAVLENIDDKIDHAEGDEKTELIEQRKKLKEYIDLARAKNAEVQDLIKQYGREEFNRRAKRFQKTLKQYGIDLEIENGGELYYDENKNLISKEKYDELRKQGKKVSVVFQNGIHTERTIKIFDALSYGRYIRTLDLETGEIMLLRSGLDFNAREGVDFVIGHELVHEGETVKSGIVKSILNAIGNTKLDSYYEIGKRRAGKKTSAEADKHWNDLKELYIKAEMKNGDRAKAEAKVTDAYMYEEIAADYMGMILAKSGNIDNLASKSGLLTNIKIAMKSLISVLKGDKLDVRAERVKELMKKLDTVVQSTYGKLAKTTEDAQKSTQSEAKTEAEQTPTETEKRAENDERMMVVGEGSETAGEIEAYDTMARRRKDADYRKNTRPNIDRTDAIVRGEKGSHRVISEAGEKLLNFYNSILSMNGRSAISKRKTDLGEISANHRQMLERVIKDELGRDIDLSGYTLWIDGSGVEHIEERHGKHGKRDQSMADADDIKSIPWAANNANSVEILHNKDGSIDFDDVFKNTDGTPAPKIRTVTVVDDGTIYVVESVPDATSKRIFIKSAYKTKSSSDQVLNIESDDSPQLTPEASLGYTASKGSISQPSQNVNSKFSLSSDSDGKQLSDKQAEYFKDSKMRDDNGNLKVMYHGTTRGGFHTFDQGYTDDKTSFFFVDRNDVASSYSGTSETYEAKKYQTLEEINSFLAEVDEDGIFVTKHNGKYSLEMPDGYVVAKSDSLTKIYEEYREWAGVGYGDVNYKVYLNLTNPLEVDAKGGNWNEIEFEPLDNGFTASGRIMWSPKKFDTREIAKYAKEQGYDGVIFKNIVDVGGYGGSSNPATVAIAFNSEQIKSVGNDAPTSDPDIRYSLSEDNERVFYTPRGIEVIQNPTSAEYRQMREDIYKEYPFLRGTGEAILRHTYDEDGNEYYWNAFEGMHRDVEHYINEKYNTRTSQQWEWWTKEDKDDYPVDYSNIRYSVSAEMDADYLSAVESGDMETAHRLVDEAAKAAGYDYHLYHGTNADFTKFDLRKYGGKNGKGEGYGIYLAANREISAPYGKNVIDSYVKFNRLAEGVKKTLTLAEVKKLVRKSCEVEAQKAVDDGEYDSIADALKDTWVSNYVYTYEYSNMSKVYDDVAKILWDNNDNDGEIINEMMASSGAHYDYDNALNFYSDVLTPTTGIDGFHYVWGNKDGSGVQNDIYLALNSEQIKSAAPVTYDDNGEVIPLSERFNAENEDIRWSLSEGVDNSEKIDYNNYYSAMSPQQWAGFYSYTDDQIENGALIEGENVYFAAKNKHDRPTLIIFDYDPNRKNVRKVIAAYRSTSVLDDAIERIQQEYEQQHDDARLGDEISQRLARKEIQQYSTRTLDYSDRNVSSRRQGGSVARYLGNTQLGKERGGIQARNLDDGRGRQDSVGRKRDDVKHSVTSEEEISNVLGSLKTMAMGSKYLTNYATYTDERIEREIQNSIAKGVPDYAKSYITWVDPIDFIYATTTSEEGRKILKEEAGSLDLERLKKETQPIHLTVNFETGEIVGHEGRHRMLALQGKGIDRVAVIIDALNDDRHNTKPIEFMSIKGQRFSDNRHGTDMYLHNMLPLSERYADDAKRFFSNESGSGVRFSVTEEVLDGSETQTYAELTRELDKLKARNEKLAHEFVKTHGKEVDRRSAMKLLNEIIEKYQGTIKAKDLLAKFEDAFAYVNTKGATVDELMTKLNGIATEIFDSAIESDDSYKEYGELLSDLRTTGITVAEQDRGGDFDDVGGWNEFRKKNFGSIKFVNDGKVMIDSKYQELATKYPEWFDDGITNPAEQAKEIASVARKLRELGMTPKDVYDGVDGQIVVNGIMGDLYSALKDADKKQTFADKAAKNVADVRLAEQMHYGAKVAEAERKADDTHMLDEMYFRRKISEIKRRAERRERYITEHYAENLDKFRESKHKQYQEKLLRSRVKDLAKRAVQPTRTKHIPEDMKGDVLKFLQKLNWASDNIGHSKYASEMRGLLSKAPKEFTKGDNIDGVNTFSEELLQDMSDFFSDKTVEEMTSDELYELNVILMRMIHEINYQDKLFHSAESASALASKAITQFTTARKERTFENWRTKLIDFIKYGAADPESFFHSLGVPVLTEAYQNLAKQQDVFARTLRELTGRMKEIVNGSIPKSWREDYKEYTLVNGQKIMLTPVQKMSLYLLSKQEASRKRLLSERGGILPTATKRDIISKQQDADGKEKVKVSVPKTTLGKRVYLTEGDLITLEGTLTKEQIDIANKISELLNGRCAELGNEVSLAEEGYRKFIVENYFPMMVAENGKTFEQLANSAKEQIAHKSFTKDRTGTAGVPLVVDDIFNVMDRHVLGMSQYYAYDKALRDFQRVWKLRPEGKDSLNLTLDQHFGNGKPNRVSNFVQNFIKDVQGAQMQVGEETLLSEKFLSTYKAAQVAGNLSVVAKQPTAIFRAMPEFSAKGMAAMMNFAKTKADIKAMIENSGLAQLKDWGFSENTTAKSVAELYDKNATNWRGKLDDVFSYLAEQADMITWAAIWRASVADTKSLPEAIDKFNEVIRKTQVVKSAFTSSRIAEQGGFAKLAFAFKNEPLKTFNYIRSTINDVAEGKEGAKKKAFAVTVATAINTAVVAAISAGFSLIRDDEEDSAELFAEKFKENVIADLVSNSTILLGDIWTAVESAMNGREVERMDLAVITDATQFARNFVDMFKKPESEQKNTWMKIVYDGARTVSNFTGIPIGNVIRAIKSVHGRVVELSDDPVARYNMTKIWYNVEGVDNASIRAKFRSILTEALDDGNYKAFAEINNDLRRHGFSAGDIEKAVSNSTRLYDAWNNGAETFRNEVNKAIKVAPMLSSTYVMEAFKSKKTALVNDLYDAMKSGSKKATSDAMSALLKHRDVDTKRVLTESDVDKLITKKIESAIKSEVKSKLADLYGTESYDAVKKKILNEYRHFEMITPEYIDKLARSLS